MMARLIIQGATKKHARLRPFPFLCEILIQFHEKIIKFDQIFVKQKIRVQGLAFWTRFFSVDQKSGFGSNDMIFVFFIGFLSLFHQNYVFFVNFCPCSSFAGVQGLAFLSSSFRGLAFRSSISTSINVLKKMSKKLKKSSKNGGTALILVFGTVLFLVFLRCTLD